jgi:hypothetical protein
VPEPPAAVTVRVTLDPRVIADGDAVNEPIESGLVIGENPIVSVTLYPFTVTVPEAGFAT